MTQKQQKKPKKTTLHAQQLLNIKQFVPLHMNDDAHAIESDDGRLYVYLMLRPDNISVLGRGEILSKIRSLQNVIENLPDMQILCVLLHRATKTTSGITASLPNPQEIQSSPVSA
ncbi:MAG: hypothetical protein ACLSB9_28480 [Hydrogeniiclostridium mannosilyticum]